MSSAARLTDGVLDVARIMAEAASPACGAVLLFVGVVREVNDGRAVTGIEYTAYRTMAERELLDIAAEAAERFGARVVVEHRLGTLALEEASVAIAVAHPHRGAAYEGSRWVIEELKRRVPIWKREHYADGAREWVNPSGQRGDGDGAGSPAGHVPGDARGTP